MIQLNYKILTQNALDHLASKQKQVNDLPDFEAKAKKADALWSPSTAAFDEIKQTLREMCLGIVLCVYCEFNEATDIEHIYPKKLYPEKTFIWENYVLACGKCNRLHKSDKFKIFNPQNSANVEDVTLPRGTYNQPANDDALFINQRKENPMDFLELDLREKTLIFDTIFSENTREYERAKYTIELLGLNTRGDLVSARKRELKFFVDRLEKYVNAKKSNDFQELKNAVDDDYGSIDETVIFLIEKERIIEAIKTDISENINTVWKELVRQRASLPKTNRLLNDAPEAVNW